MSSRPARLRPGARPLAATHPGIAAQWNTAANGSTTPHNVSAGSSQKIAWRCNAGHDWHATVVARAHGHGCPYCSGRRVAAERSLAALHPSLAAEWHPTRNGALAPTAVTAAAGRSVWWRCMPASHEWQATIANRTINGTGCPRCAKEIPPEQTLAAEHPDLAREWMAERNAPLTPASVRSGSSLRVWWRCADGHEWQARIDTRSGERATGCPVCVHGGWSLPALRSWLRDAIDALELDSPSAREARLVEAGLTLIGAKAVVIVELLLEPEPPFPSLRAWIDGEHPEIIEKALAAYDPRNYGRRRSIPPSVRAFVLQRDDYTCQNPYCPTDPQLLRHVTSLLHLDHLIPYSHGGSDDIHNLHLLCWRCNIRRQTQPWDDFVKAHASSTSKVRRSAAAGANGASAGGSSSR